QIHHRSDTVLAREARGPLGRVVASAGQVHGDEAQVQGLGGGHLRGPVSMQEAGHRAPAAGAGLRPGVCAAAGAAMRRKGRAGVALRPGASPPCIIEEDGMNTIRGAWLRLALAAVMAAPLAGCGTMSRGSQYATAPGQMTPSATGDIRVKATNNQNH